MQWVVFVNTLDYYYVCCCVQLSNRLTLVDSVTVHFVWQVHGNSTENRKFLSVFTVY